MYQNPFLGNVLTKLAMLSKNPLNYLQQQNLQEVLLYGQKMSMGNFRYSLLLQKLRHRSCDVIRLSAQVYVLRAVRYLRCIDSIRRY